VTLPMLAPSILFISVVLTTRALQTYGEVALLTGGGPEPEKSTTTIPYLIYGELHHQPATSASSPPRQCCCSSSRWCSPWCSSGASRSGCTMATDTVRGVRKLGRYSLLVFVAVVVLFPIYAVLLQSLKSGPDAFDHPRSLLPVDLTFSTIRDAWTHRRPRPTADQQPVRLGGRHRRRHRHQPARCLRLRVPRVPLQGPQSSSFYLATMLVPAEVTVVFNQRTADSWGWINTYQGLIVPSLASTFGVFLVRQVFLQLPRELREAAALDGVGHLRFLWEVAAPLSRPTLGALGLFTFLGTWNAYLWPSQVIRGDRAHETIQIGLDRLQARNDISRLNLVTGGLVVAALPIFILLVAFQRQLVRGLTAGAVKG
jgi:sn-glycerol 3-phosphate transport system permease protein